MAETFLGVLMVDVEYLCKILEEHYRTGKTVMMLTMGLWTEERMVKELIRYCREVAFDDSKSSNSREV